MKRNILIVEDDLAFGTMMQTWLGKKGFGVGRATSVGAAMRLLLAPPDGDTGTDGGFDLVLSDLRLPDRDGLELLPWMRAHGLQEPFIVMTNYAEVQNAVLAMKSGAADYIAKPVQPDILLQKINDALRGSASGAGRPAARPQEETGGQRRVAGSRPEGDGAAVPRYIEGKSEASRQLYKYVELVAPTPMSVLILGASGTGKEYVARRIHELSERRDGPFVAIDCGAVPRDVAASEFFGHRKGAFTGADADKRGAFETASGGTLFLDEVGNLGYDVQVQLLRALQERRIRPVGGTEERTVDIRLVAATNENLETAVAEGRFREDLYHRLSEFTIYMPSLKDRGDDLFLFADLFIRHANADLSRHVEGLDAGAAELLVSYAWPGNLRELGNVIRRAVLLARGEYVTRGELSQAMGPVLRQEPEPALTLHDGDRERENIVEALRQAGGNKSKAARLLGVDRKTIYNKIERLGIEKF